MPTVYRFGSLGKRTTNIDRQPVQTESVDMHIVSDGSGFKTMDAGEFKQLSKDSKLSSHLQDKITKLKVDDKKALKEKKKKNKRITFVL
jgi:hypothetical protein